uniref:Chemokine interleukin-8-like domain-containing protein n=1 Tax=Astatotilapia calliptera TaxID=8154 RepID=A0AAX7TD15_ASTCA
MVKSGSLFALVAVVLLAVAVSGSDEKLATCCKTVTNKEITEPILGYLVQRARRPCVNAVILMFFFFCFSLRKAKAQSTTPSVATTSPVSLLSIITSTASPSSSSTALPSSSATSEMSAGETFSESRND